MEGTIVVQSQRVESLKRWALCAMFVLVGVFVTYRGFTDLKLRYIVIGIVDLLFFGWAFLHFLKYILFTKTLMIMDQEGVRTEDGQKRVKWDEVQLFYFDHSTTFIKLIARTRSGEVVFKTGSLISIKEMTALLKQHDANVLEEKKRKGKRISKGNSQSKR